MNFPKRVIMLGLDAMVPNITERFLAEGVLPNLQHLIEKGLFTRVKSGIPAQTPTNWTTLATGAAPGTHGITVWGSPEPATPWEHHRYEAFSNGLCNAEYLWEAAARTGKRSVVMNYAGYPPTCPEAVHIDWLYLPSRSYFDLSSATVYHNCPELNTTDPLTLEPAEGWSDLPPSKRPHLQAELTVAGATEPDGPRFHLLVYAEGEAYDICLLAPAKAAARPIAVLKCGQWSDWCSAIFESRQQGEQVGYFRFKLVELSPDASRLQLFRTDAFPHPSVICGEPVLGEQLMEALGPYVHSGSASGLNARGLLDFTTYDEVMQAEVDWWAGAAKLAMDRLEAELLVLHWHNLDMGGHFLVGKVDPTGFGYDETHLEENWAALRAWYQAADRFVGAFLERFDLEENTVVVVSDHGMPANKRAVSLVNLFLQQGWLTLTPDGQDVDWENSKVFYTQNHLWLNVEGRQPSGQVPQAEYQAFRQKVKEAMQGLRDPETGEFVFAFVLERENAPMVGLWGEHIGDLVFCYAGGYRWSGPEVLKMGEKRVVFPSAGGNHGPMLPTYETETTSVLGTLIMAGPGIQQLGHLPRVQQARYQTQDVAPTLAHLLQVPAPAAADGRVLFELLEPAPPAPPGRNFQPMARPLVARPSVKPRPLRLQGDVTDEI